MSFPLLLARRYLFSKKSHNAINIISWVAVAGVAVSTMALVCVLSVFNGFREVIGGLYSAFDPQLEISPAQGKTMPADAPALRAARGVKGVADASACLEEKALILYAGNPVVVTVMGVDDHFAAVTGIDSIVRDEASQPVALPPLAAGGVNYGIPGAGLAYRTGLHFGQLQICAPRRGERINLANPVESFTVEDLFSTGRYFQVSQKSYDESYMLTSLDFASALFEQSGHISSLALRLSPDADETAVQRQLQATLGKDYVVRTRMEQHADSFRVMQIEKGAAFLFLTFILLIACFNIIGSVSMLIIDKRDNVSTLRALGATDRAIAQIFLFESRLITVFGAALGLTLGLLLCWAQDAFGLIKLGQGEGNFIISAYPVSVSAGDVALVAATVLGVGFLAVWYPVRYLTRKML